MKTIKIGNKEYVFEELTPNQSWNPEFPLFLTWDLGSGGTISTPYITAFELNTWRENTKIITTTNSIAEEVAKTVVEDCKIYAKCWKKYNYTGEEDKGGRFDPKCSCWTALESFYSLMDSLELDRNNKNYLLIEKLKQ